MWYKEKYRIVTENPYNKEKLNGLGLVIYSEWKDSFVNIIQKNEIKHLFLNYSLGRKCSDYTFLRYIKPIETLEIIDKFISVPAKWIKTSRRHVLNIYSDNYAYANLFKTDFG